MSYEKISLKQIEAEMATVAPELATSNVALTVWNERGIRVSAAISDKNGAEWNREIVSTAGRKMVWGSIGAAVDAIGRALGAEGQWTVTIDRGTVFVKSLPVDLVADNAKKIAKNTAYMAKNAALRASLQDQLDFMVGWDTAGGVKQQKYEETSGNIAVLLAEHAALTVYGAALVAGGAGA